MPKYGGYPCTCGPSLPGTTPPAHGCLANHGEREAVDDHRNPTGGRMTQPDEADLTLLQRLNSVGMPLRPDELASGAGMDVAEVRERMDRLVDDGFVKLSYSVTTRGGAHAFRNRPTSLPRTHHFRPLHGSVRKP